MLGNKEAIASIAVKDLAVGRKFYETVLGLTVVHAEGAEAITFQSGSSKVLVYRSQFAGTNKATAVSFMVGRDLETAVVALKQKGVRFESYDFPDASRKGEIYVFGDLETTWFKDPDGNIISLINR
ncbi:MAG TPA: VOC family protein [Polyangia bacterium]|nr:VOC family protein [Polyangia bacterium]